MSEPILTVNHLSFGFRDQQLYQDLSFQLNVGSMTSLVGPNGVGKTTLIRLLMAVSYTHLTLPTNSRV
mgnify:CR=1 FL=1